MRVHVTICLLECSSGLSCPRPFAMCLGVSVCVCVVCLCIHVALFGCLCICVYMYLCLHVCVYVCVSVCECLYLSVCVCVYIYHNDVCVIEVPETKGLRWCWREKTRDWSFQSAYYSVPHTWESPPVFLQSVSMGSIAFYLWRNWGSERWHY